MMYLLVGFIVSELFLSGNIHATKAEKKLDVTLCFNRNPNKNQIYNKKEIKCDVNNISYNIKASSYKYEFGMSGLKKSGEEFKFDIKTMRFFFNTNTIYFLIKNVNLNKILIKKLIFGNFKLGYGQGLVFNYKHDNLYRPIDPIKIFKKQKGIKKCKSNKKNKFFGTGMEIKYNEYLETTFFFSKNYYDAIIKDNYIYSAKIREKYINENNISRKNKIYDYSTGFVINITPIKILNIGVTFIYSKFNKNFRLVNNSDFADNRLKNMDNLFTGNKNINLGVFSDCVYKKKIKIYLEAAISNNNIKLLSNCGYCFIIGQMLKVNKYLKYLTHVRMYSANYHNFYGKGFGTGNGLVFKKLKGCINNETGIYNGLQIKFTDKWIYKIAIDLVYIPQRTFNFTRAFIEYVISELICNLNIYDYIKLQCKYNNLNYEIITKNLKKYKILDDNCRMKISLKKRVSRIINKTDLFLTINPNEKKHDMISFGIYEKISTKAQYITFYFHIIAMKAKNETPIYIFSKFTNIQKCKVRIFDENIILAGLSMYLNIKNLKFEILYLLKYKLQIDKVDNIFNISINYQND